MPRKRKMQKRDMMEMHDHEADGCCGGCSGMRWHRHGSMGSLYGLGFIGAVVYYIQTATGFWGGVVGVLKAIVWPAFLIYKLLGM